jgi:hypothetical protein
LPAPWRLQAFRFSDQRFQSANVAQIFHLPFAKAEMQSEASSAASSSFVCSMTLKHSLNKVNTSGLVMMHLKAR